MGQKKSKFEEFIINISKSRAYNAVIFKLTHLKLKIEKFQMFNILHFQTESLIFLMSRTSKFLIVKS